MTETYKPCVSEIVKNFECCIDLVNSIDVEYKEERKKLRKNLKKYTNLKSAYETKLKEIEEQYQLKIVEIMKKSERLSNSLKRSFDIYRQDILLGNDPSMELMQSSSNNILLEDEDEDEEENSEASGGARKKMKMNEES